MSKNFFVSSPGEYHGSGSGTGAFMLIKNNETTVIDLLDTSGLYFYNDYVFRIIRKLKLLVVYDKNGVKSFISLPEIKAAHDILVDAENIYCVCTGINQIHVYDHFGKKKSEFIFPGNGDAWHANCICKVDGELYCTAFGMFDEHRQWTTVDHTKSGFVYNVNKREKIFSGLYAPHNPLFLDGKWMVCNSLDFSLMIFGNEGERRIECGGFTRGLTYDDQFIYVGVSANRKSTHKNESYIKVFDRHSFQLMETIPVPFSEVYSVLLISDEWVENILKNPQAFQIDKLGFQIEIEKMQSKPKPVKLTVPQRIVRKLRRTIRLK